MSTPYTYLLRWSKTGRYYYGSQYGVHAHPKNLWKKYFTSSRFVAEYRKIYGDPDIIKIRKTFANKKDCLVWENKVLRRIIKDPKCLNISSNFGVHATCLSGFTTVIDQTGKTLSVSIDHPDYINGTLKHIRTGKTAVLNPITNETFSVSTNDPRFLSGELISVNKGKPTPDQTGKKWVNNGSHNKYITHDEIEYFLDSGYMLGKLQKHPNRDYSVTSSKSQLGTCWICNERTVIKIKLIDLPHYVNLGYIRGRKWYG